MACSWCSNLSWTFKLLCKGFAGCRGTHPVGTIQLSVGTATPHPEETLLLSRAGRSRSSGHAARPHPVLTSFMGKSTDLTVWTERCLLKIMMLETTEYIQNQQVSIHIKQISGILRSLQENRKKSQIFESTLTFLTLCV